MTHDTDELDPPQRPAGAWLALAALLLVGVVLRGYDLASVPLWVDEAESAINALTIRQTGLPVDTYLGLPIYENLLTEPWPEHAEYEFRDSSYSDKGVAIYHGWLPLYSVAASQLLFGVEPDTDESALTVQHDDADITRRVVAARLPSVLFGAAFLALLFVTAREMYGRDAGFAALLFGGVAEPFVLAARQARYYSLTLALSVACCLFAWRIYKHGRWRDFLPAGVLFGLLFHTHILTFVVLCATCLLALPAVVRRPGWPAKMATTAAIVTGIVLPWVLLTGFLGQAADVPAARDMLRFPGDLLAYPLRRIEFVAIAFVSLIWAVAVAVVPQKLPERLVAPMRGHGFAFVYLIAWGVIGLAAFTLLVPAASYFLKRLILAVMGPGALLTGVFAAAVARAIWPQRSGLVACGGVALLLIAGGFLPFGWPYRKADATPQQKLIAFLRTQEFAPGTRFYATPNEHLTIQYLTGLPAQSVAPVRREFLNEWPGEVVVIDPVIPFVPYGGEGIRQVALRHDVELTEDESTAWELRLRNALVRREAAKVAGNVVPPPEPTLPDFAREVIEEQRQLTAGLLEGDWSLTRENAAVFRDQPIEHWGQWWPVFFYRFVDWPSRAGENLNYAGRVRGGTAFVLESGWVVYRCPPRGDGRG